MRFVANLDNNGKVLGMVQSNDIPWWDIPGHLKQMVKNGLYEIWDGVRDFILEIIDGVTLILCSVFIILGVAGLNNGYKKAAVIFVLRILIKIILGG